MHRFAMKKQLKIISVVGARPNVMKITAISKAIEEHNENKMDLKNKSIIVHTG